MNRELLQHVSADELDAVVALLAQSFGPSADHHRRRLRHLDSECVRVLRDAGGVRGCILVRVRAIAFGGALIPVACLSSLAVEPGARGRGHGTALLAHALARARAAAAPLAVLHTTRTALYEKLGFARAGSRWLCRFPPRALGERRGDHGLRLAAQNDGPALHRLHIENARLHDGNIAFGADELLRRRRAPRRTFVHTGPGGVDGFVVLGHRRDPAIGDVVLVHEFVARDAGAAAALRARIAAESSGAGEVRWHFGPEEARAARLDESLTRFEELGGWMLAVVDARRALAARGFPAGVRDAVAMRIETASAHESAPPFRLVVAGARGSISPAAAANVQLDRPTLALLFSAAESATRLAERELLRGDAPPLAALDRMFAGGPPSLQDLV
jgi:predicted acetyltransferase